MVWKIFIGQNLKLINSCFFLQIHNDFILVFFSTNSLHVTLYYFALFSTNYYHNIFTIKLQHYLIPLFFIIFLAQVWLEYY